MLQFTLFFFHKLTNIKENSLSVSCHYRCEFKVGRVRLSDVPTYMSIPNSISVSISNL